MKGFFLLITCLCLNWADMVLTNHKNRKMYFNSVLSKKFYRRSTDLRAVDYEPIEVGAEIWIGSIVSLIPIVWATYEFTSRLRIQRECLLCKGTGINPKAFN